MLHEVPSAEATRDPSPVLGAGDAAQRHRTIAIRLALVASIALVVWVALPYLGWLVLAAWFASLTRPLLDRIGGGSSGRRRAAALLTVALTLVLLVPLSFLVVSVALDAADLIDTLARAESARAALEDLVSHGGTAPTADVDAPGVGMASVADFVRGHSDRAFELAISAAGSIVQALLGLMVLLGGAFSLLVHGPALLAWAEDLAPASHANMTRLGDAFVETGRGLLIGSGLTGLTQAAIGTILYVSLGVPRPLVLGLLTLVTSVIPGLGTALVWVPVTAGLFIAGRTTEAILMGVLGAIFVAGIDNVVRPFFVRWGRLALDPFVVMIAVFGGLAAFGPWGILFGPIVMRVGLEIVRIARDERVI